MVTYGTLIFPFSRDSDHVFSHMKDMHICGMLTWLISWFLASGGGGQKFKSG